MSHSSAPERENGAVITDWRPEDPAFWQQRGHRVASRNLWISVPCLLLAFCVWMLFSAVAVNLPKVGFTFTTDQLFMLTALPSLSGALLRVPYAFMVPVFGGRRWTAFSTGIMIVPCVWLGFAVQDTSTPFSVFVIISLLCGFAEQTKSDRVALAACIETSRVLVTRDEARKIDAPTLIAVGTKDDIAGSGQELADLMPNARAIDIPNRDHMLAVGDRVFKAAVLEFYADLT